MSFDNLIKPNKDEKLDTIISEIKQLKNVSKITELDLEKRIIILEGTLSEVKNVLGDLKGIQDLTQFVKHLDDVKGKLNEIEDFSLIEKLETVELQDELEQVVSTNDILKQKVDLLVEAVRNIDPNEGDMAKTLNSIKELSAKTDTLNKTLTEMRQAGITKENFDQLRDGVARALGQQAHMSDEFQNLTHTVREQLELLSKKIDDSTSTQNYEVLKSQIILQGKDVASVKESHSRLSEIVEKSIKKLDSSAFKADVESIKKLRASVEEIYSLVDMYKKKVDELQQNAVNAKTGSDDVKYMVHDILNDELSGMMASIDDISAGISAKLNDLKEFHGERMQSLEQKLLEQQFAIDRLGGIMQSADSKSNESNKLLFDHTAKIAILEAKLSDAGSSINAIKDYQSTVTKEEFESLHDQLYGAKSDVESVKASFEETQQTINKKLAELSQNAYSAIKEGMERMKAMLESQEPKVTESDLEDLKRKINALARENLILRGELDKVKKFAHDIEKEHNNRPLIID